MCCFRPYMCGLRAGILACLSGWAYLFCVLLSGI
jgi:hypothetical protein